MDEGEARIREIWDRWNAGERDPESDFVHPEVEVESALTGNRYTGPEGLRTWISEIGDQFESWRLSIEDVRPLADGWYAVRGSIHARGRHSGLDLDQPASWRVQVRDRKLLRLENFIGQGFGNAG